MMKFPEPPGIIESIKNRDRGALLEIYQIYFPQIRHYILSNSGNQFDAEDIFQDAMVIVYMKVKESTFSLTSSFSTYLLGVARFLWLEELLRKRKFFGTDTGNINLIGIQDDLIDDYLKLERRKLLLYHFNELSEDCKKLLGLYFNEVPVSRITVLMGYSNDQYTKNRRLACKERLIRTIWNNPRFKELKNEAYQQDTKVPRW